MAMFTRGALAAPGQVPAAPTNPEVRTDGETEKGTAVYPEVQYLVSSALAIVLGAVLGVYVHDRAGGITFTPPEGVGIFALFYIVAQVIERIQEPLSPYLARAPSDEGERRNQREAKAELENAVAHAVNTPSPVLHRAAANKKRTVDQVRANLTVLMFGTSALLAMLLMGYLKAGLLRAVGVAGILTWVDVLVTGLVVAAGTKPLHDLIANLSAAKEERQNPPGTA